jgi:hypothetical protein
MLTAKLIHWAFTFINFINPAESPKYGLAMETTAEAIARYESIASDAVEVVSDEHEQPIYSDDENGREKTLAVLLAIARYESGGFRKDVDNGTTRGDGGHSYCIAQVNLRGGHIVVKDDGSFEYSHNAGWTGDDLVKDRKKCFRAALAVLRASFRCVHRMSLARKLFDELRLL